MAFTIPKTQTRQPGSTLLQGWQGSGGGPHHALVADNPVGSWDGDASYVYTSNPGTQDMFGLDTPFNIPIGATITNLTIRTVGRRASVLYAQNYGEIIKVGGQSFSGSNRAIDESYLKYSSVWTINPQTGVAWKPQDINGWGPNSLQGIGIQHVSGHPAGITYCTAVWVDIFYTVPGKILIASGILSRLFRSHRSLDGSLYMQGVVQARTFEVRAMYVMGAYLYVLVGKDLWKIDSAWAKTLLGSVGTTTGKAWIVGDGTNLCVVDSVKGYSWNGAAWAEITFPDTFAPSSLTFQDGYFIVTKTATGRFYISALLNPTSWNALDYATAEGSHDNLVVAISHNRELWLLGSNSIEFWYNSGAAAFPFERATSGGFINIGCRAARSVVSSEGNIFWLDSTLKVRMITGTQSEIISTPQIEYQISLMGQLSEAVGFYYFQKGHGFYQLTIGDIGSSKTFVFDTTTKYWHTRTTGLQQYRHPAQCYAFFNNKHLVGHYSRGQILALDYTVYTNNGDLFTAIRAAQAVHADRKRIFHKQLEIEFESGVGVDASTDPEAVLQWSDDGGHTWSNEHTATFGKLGEYSKRAIWRRLGNSRGRVYRVTINDPVKRVIIGANLEAESGRD